MTKIEIDLELLSKEQLVGLVKSLIEKQKKQKPAKVQEIVAEPEVEVRVEKEVVYRTIPTEEPESIKIKKVRGRGKAKRIPLPVRRAVIIADAVNKLQKPVVFRTITDQHTDLFGGHLQGSSYSALKTELQKSKKVTMEYMNGEYIVVPRGYTGSLYVGKKKRKHRRPYNNFIATQIPKYHKMGHSSTDSMRLAVADWNSFGKGQVQHLAKTKDFELVEKEDKVKVLWIDTLSDNDGAQRVIKPMLKHTMESNGCITYNVIKSIVTMEYHEWITFVNEICRKSAQIKDYFGDTSSKTWKYVNQKLVFK